MHEEINASYLIDGLLKSDPISFKMIYKLYWKKLYRVAYSAVQSETEAEDIVQDVFSSLWYRREHLHIKVSLENYLIRATKYTAYFYLKIRHKNEVISQQEEQSFNDCESHMECKELETLIQRLLDSLPYKTKRIFSLSRFEGLTYSQIAEETGLSIKAVEYHISLALKQFSKGLSLRLQA